MTTDAVDGVSWGGKRNGAGRKPDLSEIDQLLIAKLAVTLIYFHMRGKGKRLYGLRQLILETTSREFTHRFKREITPNAVAKALRRYKNHPSVKEQESQIKNGLGMLHHFNVQN